MATELTTTMKGSLCHEYETGLPAADVWGVYGGLLVGQLIPQLLPQVFSKVELVEGDGGAGTVLLVTFPPGTPGSETFKEKFIKVDDENYIKEALVTEGGFLDHGFKKYLVRIEIIGKEEKTSIIRSTIEYEVDHEYVDNPPVVSTSGLATIAEAITKHVKEQKGPEPGPVNSKEDNLWLGLNVLDHTWLGVMLTSQTLSDKMSSCSCLQLPQKSKVYYGLATDITKAVKGSVCHEYETGLPAADVWKVYGGLLAGQLVPQLVPEVFSKVQLIGDGGVGTVLLVSFPPGTSGSETFKEKFIKVDNENYIKEAIIIEGGFLDHGFKKYLIRFEIIPKEEKTSIIRSTIEYEVDDEHKKKPPVASASGFAAIAEAITKYIKEKSTEQAPEQLSEEQSIQLN